MKIGLCTGGGDCPGLNAAIRAVTIHATRTYKDEVIGLYDSFNGLMEDPLNITSLDRNNVSELLFKGGTILGTTNKGNPFDIKKESKNTQNCSLSERVMQGYKKLGLDAVIVVGGDGTQTIAFQLSQLGMKVIGIPKTIDNDLLSTTQTIGFDTAVGIASESIARLRSTAESHHRIMVLEVMGRDAGHIALHSGVGQRGQCYLTA